MATVIIRKETQSDIEIISDITKSAFKNHPYSQITEHFIIKDLRISGALAVSLVAENNGVVLVHIAFSPVTFTDESEDWYGLGPVSVLPDRQRQGIGTKLVNEGLKQLNELNAAGCVLVGEPDFYERFGFKSPDCLKYEGVPQENFLILPFGEKIPNGEVKFHQAFGATE